MTDTEKGTYSAPDGSPKWEYLATFCCTLLMLCIGTVVGWNSPSLTILMSPVSLIPITASDASSMAALVAVGHMAAPTIAAAIVDKFGRRNTLLITGTPLVISWAMIVIAKNVMTLYVARFIAGLSLGLAICICPMYLGEIASPEGRGAVGIVMATMYNIGILFAFLIGPYLSTAMMALVCMVLAIAFLISFWFMPESPYFLAMVGKNEEAEAALEKLRGRTHVTEELESLVNTVHEESKNHQSGSFKELFTVRGNRRGFFIVLLFIVSHHFGGFYSLMTYGQLIFKELGSLIPDHLATDALAVVQLVSTILTIFVVDRLGRRPLILFSGVTSGLCSGIIGAFFFATEHMKMDLSDYAIIPFVAVLILVFAMNCGLVPLQIVLMSEIFPTSIKALASCSIGVIGGVLGTVGTKMYLITAVTWGYGHCAPFLTFCLVTWSVTFLLLLITPETKGKTFAEIQKKLNK